MWFDTQIPNFSWLSYLHVETFEGNRDSDVFLCFNGLFTVKKVRGQNHCERSVWILKFFSVPSLRTPILSVAHWVLDADKSGRNLKLATHDVRNS